MKIKCRCGKIVAEGNIELVETKRGTKKRFFLKDKSTHFYYDMYGNKNIGKETCLPQGTIIKNKSNDPEKWSALCSKCQGEQND